MEKSKIFEEKSTNRRAITHYISVLLEHEMKFHDVLKTTTELHKIEYIDWH